MFARDVELELIFYPPKRRDLNGSKGLPMTLRLSSSIVLLQRSVPGQTGVK